MQLTGSWFDFFIAFFSGVLVSFTPCVYPVMPLTASFIAGANAGGSRSRAFILSSVYVLGMAIVYAALAIVAGLTGKIFGQLQNTPVFLFSIGGMLVLFSIVMMDLIHMPILTLSSPTVYESKPTNLLAVLLFGMTTGLVVGPCTAPVLGSLLVYVSTKQNLFLGALLMFVFAYGVGFSLILVGTFSGLLSRLPKSGKWLVIIKKTSGLILLVMGLFFIYKGIIGFIK